MNWVCDRHIVEKLSLSENMVNGWFWAEKRDILRTT
jgi:hypothetical protein